MIRIVCTSCQKPLSLDETKLPMKEVSFPCPVCKAKLAVDRRTLEGAGAPASRNPEAAAAPQAPPAPAPAAQPHRPDVDDGESEGFGSKALLVGNDHPALRQA